jgi:hypothetical protein
MSAPRRLNQLDLLQQSTDRLVKMVLDLPYTFISNKKSGKESEHLGTIADQALHLHVDDPAMNEDQLSMTDWAMMLYRHVKPLEKSNDKMSTRALLLDEIVRYLQVVTESIMLGTDRLQREKVGAKAGEPVALPGGDDIIPFVVSLLPSDQAKLFLLSHNMNMLCTILDTCRRFLKANESKYKLSEKEYDTIGLIENAATSLSSAILATIETHKVKVEAESKPSESSSPQPAEKQKREAERAEKMALQDKKSAERLELLRGALERVDIGPDYPNYISSYSPKKYNHLLQTIGLMAGADYQLASDLRKLPVNKTSASEIKEPASESKASAKPVPVISDESAKKFDKFSKKRKIERLFNMALDISSYKSSDKGDIPPQEKELKYHLLLLALVITMGETSQRLRPSELRLSIEQILASSLDKQHYDSNTDYAFYKMKESTPTQILNFKKSDHESWYVNATVSLFNNVLQLAKPGRETELVANLFLKFLDIKMEDFRDKVLREMQKRNVLEKMLITVAPAENMRKELMSRHKIKLPENTQRSVSQATMGKRLG